MKAAVILAAFSPASASAATTVAAGSNFTLVASAEGTPAPTFQWRKNGTAISGATGTTLRILGATSTDAASYQVVATNTVGSVVSAEEVITVAPAGSGVAPSFVSQPAATQTVSAGGSAQFSVVVAGVPTPSLQWKKDGVAVAGATNATLALSALTANDSGTYVVTATNTVGSVTSAAANLTVTGSTAVSGAPVITSFSPNSAVEIGGRITLAVVASGTGPFTCVWKKDGVQLPNSSNELHTIYSFQASDAGSYVVTISNSAGSATSVPAVLSVAGATPPPPPPGAPVITSFSKDAAVALGGRITLGVVATGTGPFTYAWKKDGVQLPNSSNELHTIYSFEATDAGSYVVIVSNSAGSATSTPAVLSVISTTPPPPPVVQSAPVFTAQPLPQTVPTGTNVTFTVAVSALPGATLQWERNRVAIPGATSSVLILNSVRAENVGNYRVIATNSLGSATSNEVPLSLGTPPIINSQPQDTTAVQKKNVTFSVSASGSPSPTYQWKKNGVAISGATNTTMTLKGVGKADMGDYTVEVRNSIGWVLSNRATLTVTNPAGKVVTEDDAPAVLATDFEAPTGLVNLSVRANAGTGNNGLIVGFVIDGNSSKSVLVRGVGPSLGAFGVSGALLDPQLSLYAGAAVTASNDDWSSNENVAQILGASARVGAFNLVDRAADSALMAALAHGAYTVQLTGKDSESGVALVELYDATSGGDAKLVNLSVRTYIGSVAEAPNVGFVVAGTAPRRLLIRAVGPTLGGFGVSDAIADPQLELYRGSARVDANDNWGGSASMGTTFAQVGAFGFADGNSKDSVLVATLEPGAYTVVVSGVNGSKGIGLVEVYDAP